MLELKGRVVKDSNEKVDLVRMNLVAVEKALPIKWRTKEETFHDTMNALLARERKFWKGLPSALCNFCSNS